MNWGKSIYVDPVAESKYPKHYMATVEVKEKSGKSHKATVEYPKGDPENPLSREEVLEKYYALATKTIPESQAKQLADRVLDLENISDMRDLAALLGNGG